jgi:4-aminobutyrate aminotransferase/(S)-3-amino-2-methylpropionate transaminase
MLSSVFRNSAKRVITRPVTRVRFLATVQQKDKEVAAFFPDEPAKPNMVSTVPGPKSKQIMNQLNKYQDTRSVFFVAGKYR